MSTSDPVFERHRPRLFALAYRLLGSRTDAEDVMQDAWLRWHQAQGTAIQDPEAWLVTATTRLGIDRLRAARIARSRYVGPWLPEPLTVADEAPDPAQAVEISGQVSLAFLALLEQLGPGERAAFLLKDVFDYDHARIAELLGCSEDNARQRVHRARMRLRAARPRFHVDPARHRALLEGFMRAARDGDRDAIASLLDADARLVSDGGGKATAALRPLRGAERIARLYWAVARRPRQPDWRIGTVNGETAILRHLDGRLVATTTIAIGSERIVEVLNMMNPDKLMHLH